MAKATTAPAPKFVSYYRVSTDGQGVSGLGLEAQRAAVASYVAQRGGKLLAEFSEVESGRKRSRPELQRALRAAREQDAVLVCAKLDRLARNVAFLSALMDAGTQFVALDVNVDTTTTAGRFTLHVLSAMAEAESRAASDRTKAALQAARARGTKLGRPQNLTPAARKRGGEATARKAAERYRIVGPLCLSLRASGMTLEAIARRLTELRAETEKTWHRAQVARVLKYAERVAA